MYSTYVSKTLQIRHVPKETHAAVKARAAQAGESVSDHLLGLVTDAVSCPSMAEITQRAKDAANSGGADSTDIHSVIREGRNR